VDLPAGRDDFCQCPCLSFGRSPDPRRRAGCFADKAYSDQALRETLERRGLIDGVAWRGRPHHPLEDWQRLINSWSSSIRCGGERAHARMKQWYGMSRVRYRGLARNACHLRFVVAAMNMKRALMLIEQN
jgi:IS5 family transposase